MHKKHKYNNLYCSKNRRVKVQKKKHKNFDNDMDSHMTTNTQPILYNHVKNIDGQDDDGDMVVMIVTTIIMSMEMKITTEVIAMKTKPNSQYMHRIFNRNHLAC